jgi:hypothetical protein
MRLARSWLGREKKKKTRRLLKPPHLPSSAVRRATRVNLSPLALIPLLVA